MTQSIRISLPGYNALTDTDLDHFALHTDSDNVLIKEFTRGSVDVVGDGSEVIETIAHNLGYIPFFLVFVYDTQSVNNNNKWKLLAHNTAGGSVPDYIAIADTTNLYIYNFVAATITFKYFIFYDNVVGSSGITLSETNPVLKVAKQGYDVLTEKDPNHLIFHSDLNTFKILKEGSGSISYTTAGVYSFNHGLSLTDPAAYALFIEFPDGKVALMPGKGQAHSYNSVYVISDSYIDTTQIGMYISGSGSNTFNYKFYIFETPLP